MSTPTPRRQRHLLDPNDIRGSHQRSVGTAQELNNVQRWVLSVLAVTTILHLAAGAAVAAIISDRLGARIGLNVIAAIVGVLAVAAGRAIHRKGVASPWLLLGLLPGIVGLAITFGWF